jgi:hypothetical protein
MTNCYSCKLEITEENKVSNSGKSSGIENCCRQCNIKRVSEWYLNNKDKKCAYDKKRREEKRELYREASKRHRDNHPAKKKADTITRRQGIKQRTPVWANLKYMNLFYKFAKVEEIRTNRKVHVDHIYPLKADWVCGLHCENNLQLLFADTNCRKSNHYSLEYQGRK